MKKTELLFASIALIALLLKLAHLPGANFLIVISLSFLATLYFYLGFALFNNIQLRNIGKKESCAGISAWRIIGAISAGMALSQTTIGILFSLLHWPGALVLLQVGLIGLALTLIVGFIKYLQSKSVFYPSLSKRIVIVGSVGILMLTLIKITLR